MMKELITVRNNIYIYIYICNSINITEQRTKVRKKERVAKSREKLKSVTLVSTVTCETRYVNIQKGMTRIILLLLSNLSSERGGQCRGYYSTDSNTGCGKTPCPNFAM